MVVETEPIAVTFTFASFINSLSTVIVDKIMEKLINYQQKWLLLMAIKISANKSI